jgi:uncharacterized cupin superfamily protein
VPFPELGFNLRVLVPGQSRWLYHAESTQEDLLVLAGECLLLVEEEERPLRAWDFVHCPGGTRHAFVATGDDPCIIAMAGARTAEQTFLYPLSELACRHGVGVEQETTSPTEAQPSSEWRLGRPNRWADLPWA